MKEDSFEDLPRSANFQIAPLPDESGWGYLYRLAEANGYVDADQVIAYIEALFDRPLPHFIDASQWEALAPRNRGAIAAWLDDLPGFLMVDEAGYAAKRHCPECLREGRPFSAIWEGGQRTCGSHFRSLKTRCWRCHRRLFWTEGRLDACRCGALLLEPKIPFRFEARAELCAQELAIADKIENAERESKLLDEGYLQLAVSHPLDPEFDPDKVPPGSWQSTWWQTGPPPEDFDKPLKFEIEEAPGMLHWRKVSK